MAYKELIQKVEQNGYEIFWQGATSESTINSLEQFLSCRLPPSFRDFLREYGGGGVVGQEISGIEDDDASLDYKGTVLGDTRVCRDAHQLLNELFVIYYTDEETVWCLDMRNSIPGSECPVVSFDVFQRCVDRQLAPSFGEFFTQYLKIRGRKE